MSEEKIVCSACIDNTRSQMEVSKTERTDYGISIVLWNMAATYGWIQTRHSYLVDPDRASTFYICPKCQRRLLEDKNMPDELRKSIQYWLKKYEEEKESLPLYDFQEPCKFIPLKENECTPS